MYSYLHAVKLKTFGNIASVGAHNSRAQPPPNSDPKKKDHLLLGSMNLTSDVKKHLAEKGISKLRKNGVIALELLLAFSPEYLRDSEGKYLPNSGIKLKKWVNSSFNWLQHKFGDRLVNVWLHGSEANYHIHATIIPSEKKDSGKWKLNARGITGGREKLSELQDSYAASVSSLGLKRGVKGSKAKHQTLKKYYAQVNDTMKYSDELLMVQPSNSPSSQKNWLSTAANMRDELRAEQHDDIKRLRSQVKQLAEINKILMSQQMSSPERKLTR
jgi:hypothetical protein